MKENKKPRPRIKLTKVKKFFTLVFSTDKMKQDESRNKLSSKRSN